MEAKPEQPKPTPVMDVVAPPAPVADEKPNTVSAQAAAESAADDPVLEPEIAQPPAADESVAAAPAQQPPVEHAAPQVPKPPSNPAMPVVIITIVVMVVLSAIAVYAYLKSVR